MSFDKQITSPENSVFRALRDCLQTKGIRKHGLFLVFGQRAVQDTLKRMVAQAARTITPLTAVLIDLDHFKQINDLHGHSRGDEVLRRFGMLLSERMRRSDILCRFGGEEFVLLVDNCDDATLAEILDGLMKQFRGLRFGAGEDLLDDCTFSAGVALLDVDGADFESLVRVADLRMYRAKAAGRARVCFLDA